MGEELKTLAVHLYERCSLCEGRGIILNVTEGGANEGSRSHGGECPDCRGEGEKKFKSMTLAELAALLRS